MNSSPEPMRSERAAQLEDLPVRIGARVQLLFSRTGRAFAHSSTLLGYAAHEFLIVKAPIENGLTLKVQNEEWLKVRLFSGVHLIEFDTSVRRQFGPPIFYWHLGYPAVVRTLTLRAARRVPVDLAARVDVAGQPAPAEVRIVDMNELGAKVVAPAALGGQDSTIKLAFKLPVGTGDDSVQFSISARIKSSKVVERAGETAEAHAHGVQFEGLSEHEKLILQSYVLLRLNEVHAEGG